MQYPITECWIPPPFLPLGVQFEHAILAIGRDISSKFHVEFKTHPETLHALYCLLSIRLPNVCFPFKLYEIVWAFDFMLLH